MTDDRILELAEEAGITIGVRPMPRPVRDGDVIRYERPAGLTFFGMNLVKFARLVEAETQR